MGKLKIEFDLEEFKTWLDDLIDVEHQNCGPWDTITDSYELDEDANLHYCIQWSNYKETIKKRMEIVIKGEIK
jgi:hypothetical protein